MAGERDRASTLGQAGVIGMTRQLAVQYGRAGVRVNAICPGHIVTESIGKMWGTRLATPDPGSRIRGPGLE